MSADSLRRLGVGWAYDDGRPDGFDFGDVVRSTGRVWSFPMRDSAGQVLGIRYRSKSAEKWGVQGQREGLFLPTGLPESPPLLAVTEGATDCAALPDLGFATVGRPSATGGERHVTGLARRLRPASVAVVSDLDGHGAGRHGARSLATALLPYCRDARVIAPPHGV